MLWRAVASIQSGSIWLRGQKLTRTEDPFWFWVYVATYFIILSVMVYGLSQAISG